MSNTIGGCNLAAIAQESIENLKALFAPLNALALDLSPDISQRGASVTTRYAVNPTAVDLSSGYSAGNVTSTAKTVNLSSFYGFVAGFTDLERSKSSIMLDQLFYQPMLQALGKKVFGDMYALITEANFPAYYTSTAANFDRSDIADIAAVMTIAGAPKQGRALICNPTFYASLVKSLNSAEIPGITLDKAEGIVPRVAGYDIYETTEAGDNSENLGAVALQKNALIMAARSVDSTGAAASGVEVADVVIPGLNLPIQFRRWYSPNEGLLKISAGVLYGFAVGQSAFADRVVTSHA